MRTLTLLAVAIGLAQTPPAFRSRVDLIEVTVVARDRDGRLVRDLTDAWGVLPVTDGKVVWTQLSTGAAV